MHLFTFLSTMWNQLPKLYFQNLNASMPKRVRSVREQRGRPIKY